MGTPKPKAQDANLTISGASYSGTSFGASGEDSSHNDIFFNPAGTRMFLFGFQNTTIFQYTLGTGFDVSTASYDNISFDVSGQDIEATGIFFNNIGTKLFVVGRDNDRVYQYTLGTGFDLSTASYDSVSFDVSSEDGNPQSIFFNSTGTKMFMVGFQNDTIFQYTLSTGFDLSTASYDNVSFDVSSQDVDPENIDFNSIGTKLFMLGRNSERVYQYTLGTGFDISTASYDNISFLVASQDNIPQGIFFNPTGTKMFMIGSQNSSVYPYDL
jgi:phosphomevalonate kinase